MDHLDGYLGPEPSPTLSATLRRRSLDAPGGYPVFRVVHSEYVYEQLGGEWNDWDDNVAVEDRGRLSCVLDAQGVPVPMARPLRTVIEIRTVPTYCAEEIQGWVLERWFPAHMFGSPESHYADVVPGTSLPRRGPYPERGKYVMLTGPFPEEPSLDFLQDFISSRQRWFETVQAQEIEAYIRQRCYDREQAYEKKRKHDLSEMVARMMDASKNVLLGSSLAAGRIRSRAAEKMGIFSHVGN
jgi:hypothetical protein